MPIKCIICNLKQPYFGFPDDKVANYCKSCKLDGMIDIKHQKCIICNLKRPIFGNLNDKVAKYCCSCKLEGMIDIKSKKCIKCNLKQPYFGLPNDKVANYCGICKLDGMINIINSKCIVCNLKIPIFSFLGDKIAKYCGSCKLDGMIDIKSKKCIKCKLKIPSFGFPDNKNAKYCKSCKLDDMNNIISPICKSIWCNTRITNKYDGYCAYCSMHLFPDKPMAKNYKTKEIAVSQYVKNQFNKIDIITDKIIQGGCSRRRPDIFIDLGFQIIIVEVDENQHIDYDCSCENKRIMELSKDVDHRPIIFIRFNPDDYETSKNKITSCWGINKSGLCSIKKSKEKEWNERLQVLYNTINYWLENKTIKMVEIIQLFYDE